MFYTSRRKHVLAGIALALLIIGLGALSFAIAAPKASPVNTIDQTNAVTSQNVTLTGRFGCLPHKNTGGPQTMECALGMLGDDENNYIVDSETMDGMSEMATGGRFSVQGILVPIETLSTNQWQKYDVRGVIQVVSWAKL